MARLWRARRWRLLLNVIEGLPRNSAYGESLALDETLVDPAGDRRKTEEMPRPSVREWSPEVELLAAIFDRLNGVIQIQSEKNLRLKPWPSPVTAAEVLRNRERRNRRKRLDELIAEAKERGRRLADEN